MTCWWIALSQRDNPRDAADLVSADPQKPKTASHPSDAADLVSADRNRPKVPPAPLRAHKNSEIRPPTSGRLPYALCRLPQALRRLPQNSSPATSHSSQTAGEARAYARFASLNPLIVVRMTTNPLPSNSKVMADRRVACLGPVPGSTAASAVLIGALADEPPPKHRPAGRGGRRGDRDTRGRVWSPRPSDPPTWPPQLLPAHTRRARVQGLPSNSSYGGPASCLPWPGPGEHGRLGRAHRRPRR